MIVTGGNLVAGLKHWDNGSSLERGGNKTMGNEEENMILRAGASSAAQLVRREVYQWGQLQNLMKVL